jgi:hypothetical protein
MKVVSTTYEMEHGDHIYRLINDVKGVLVRRTRVDDPLWGHGILTQMINENGVFVPGFLINKHKYFNTMAEATKFIGEQ